MKYLALMIAGVLGAFFSLPPAMWLWTKWFAWWMQ